MTTSIEMAAIRQLREALRGLLDSFADYVGPNIDAGKNALADTVDIVAPIPAAAGYRCPECCARSGEPHVAGCSEIAAPVIEQWSSGQPIPECPICQDTGVAFGKVCECGK